MQDKPSRALLLLPGASMGLPCPRSGCQGQNGDGPTMQPGLSGMQVKERGNSYARAIPLRVIKA